MKIRIAIAGGLLVAALAGCGAAPAADTADAGFGSTPVKNSSPIDPLYKELDSDHDGKLSYQEMIDMPWTQSPWSDTYFKARIFALMDNDHDGTVTAAEFSNLKTGFNRAQMQSLFEFFDADRDGKLTLQELANSAWGQEAHDILADGRLRERPATPAEAQANARSLMKLYDTNHDGVITFGELWRDDPGTQPLCNSATTNALAKVASAVCPPTGAPGGGARPLPVTPQR